MDVLDDPQTRAFGESIIASAAANWELAELPADDPQISSRIEHNDMAFAFWFDASMPNGFGVLPVKGFPPDSDGYVKGVTIPRRDMQSALDLQARYRAH